MTTLQLVNRRTDDFVGLRLINLINIVRSVRMDDETTVSIAVESWRRQRLLFHVEHSLEDRQMRSRNFGQEHAFEESKSNRRSGPIGRSKQEKPSLSTQQPGGSNKQLSVGAHSTYSDELTRTVPQISVAQ